MNTATNARARPSLWRYLWVWTLGALVSVWLVLLVLAWFTSLRETRKFMDGHLIAVAQLWLSDAPWSSVPEPQSHPDLRRSDHEYAQDVAVIVWEDGRLVSDSHRLAAGLVLAGQALPEGMRTLEVAHPQDGVQQWRAYVQTAQIQGRERRVAALINLRHRYDLAADISEHLAAPVLLLLPLAAFVLWWTIRRGLRPLQQLSADVAALDAFAGQRLDDRHRFREFSSTVTAINTLVDTLQSRAQRERAFASDVAHELRTPLAALALQAQAAQTEPSAECLQQLQHEALRAGRILAQLLDLARAQRSGTEGEPAQADLGAVAGELVAAHAQQAHETGHELALLQPEKPVMVRVQPMLLELALRNLIENALRHTPPGTQVQVEIWETPQAFGVAVCDDGRRADAPALTSPKSHSMGLGLRLVERMAEQMGARLSSDAGLPPMTTRYGLHWPR